MSRRSIVNMYGEKISFFANADRDYNASRAKRAGASLEREAVKAREAGLSYGKYTSGMPYRSEDLHDDKDVVIAGHEVRWMKNNPGWQHIDGRKPCRIRQEVAYAM